MRRKNNKTNQSRRNTRASKKLYETVNKKFGELTQKFTEIYLDTHYVPSEKSKVTGLEDFEEELIHKWKSFAKFIIYKNPDTFSTTEKRNNLINRFNEFIDSIKNQ